MTTTTHTTRSRSKSIGSGSAKTAAAVLRHDGINPYAPPPISERYNQMVEDGRERALKFFQNPMGAENVHNDVAYLSVVTKGNAELDKFRITTHAQKGLTPEEQQKIQNFIGYVPLEHGATSRIWFVYVPHTQYDRRVLGFEFSWRDWLFIATAVLVIIAIFSGVFLPVYATSVLTGDAAAK